VIGGLWLAVFAGGLGAVYAGIALGYDGSASVAVVTLVAGALLLAWERLAPLQPAWLTPDGQFWPDIGHLFFGFGLGTFGGTWLAQWLIAEPLWAIWPTSWPLLAQVIAGLILSEFFYYWQHRAVHTVPALWHLHALHHSTERMTFFKTTRIHALDIGSATFLSIGSLLAIGAPLPVLLWITAFGNFTAQTQHANVGLRTPAWLNAIVGTPAVHWLHHSLDKREGNSNFAMNLMIWDHLFGTYLPPGRESCQELGIEPNPVPPTFAGQLAMPRQMVHDLVRRT
jgi:sterol desaturase/sphingolipid hydroxylase (fatty acid hydroxylase superfamily)